MTEVSLAERDVDTANDSSAEVLHGEEHLAARCMFLNEYDLLDIDHGHFWYKGFLARRARGIPQSPTPLRSSSPRTADSR